MRKSITCFANILYLLLAVFIYSSCSETNDEEKEAASPDPYFTTELEAYQLASVVKPNYNQERSQTKDIPYKRIKDIISAPDKDGKNAFYIINYKEGGFIIISADKRAGSILAFSEDNNIPLDQHEVPGGLIEWFSLEQEHITYIRNNPDSLNVEQKKLSKRGDDFCEYQKLATFMSSGAKAASDWKVCELPYCPAQYYEAGPLLKTQWGQGTGYNNMAPDKSCSQTLNKKAWTGCVATATAQLMKYHEYPKTYNWDSMPLNYGTNETSKLMSDIGIAVGMNYGCDGSGAKTKNVQSALKDKFKYTSANYSDFNLDTAKSEIFYFKRPIIVSGGRKSGWWIFASYKDGHAWVCDGYKETWIYSDDCYTGWENTYLHMNWGWDGKWNGWFSYSNWSVDGKSFNYEKKMLTAKP